MTNLGDACLVKQFAASKVKMQKLKTDGSFELQLYCSPSSPNFVTLLDAATRSSKVVFGAVLPSPLD